MIDDSYSPGAKHYDAAYSVKDDLVDVDFYLDLANEYGGPVLEFGCGTGRIQCLKSERLEHAVRAAPRQWFVDRMHTHSRYLRFINVNTSRKEINL